MIYNYEKIVKKRACLSAKFFLTGIAGEELTQRRKLEFSIFKVRRNRRAAKSAEPRRERNDWTRQRLIRLRDGDKSPSTKAVTSHSTPKYIHKPVINAKRLECARLVAALEDSDLSLSLNFMSSCGICSL